MAGAIWAKWPVPVFPAVGLVVAVVATAAGLYEGPAPPGASLARVDWSAEWGAEWSAEWGAEWSAEWCAAPSALHNRSCTEGR